MHSIGRNLPFNFTFIFSSVELKSYKELFTRKQMEERYKSHVSRINTDGQDETRNILFKKYKHIYEGE